MKLSQFKYRLPEELIAQYPAQNRDESRMMVLHRRTGEIEHRIFKDILNYFDDGDVMVYNDTKVFPALLYGNKEKTGARIEVFLLRELNPDIKLWDVLVEPARKIRIGNKLYFGDAECFATPPRAAAHCASSTTAPATPSSATSMPWATPRCPSTSSASPTRRTPSATSASSPATKAP